MGFVLELGAALVLMMLLVVAAGALPYRLLKSKGSQNALTLSTTSLAVGHATLPVVVFFLAKLGILNTWTLLVTLVIVNLAMSVATSKRPSALSENNDQPLAKNAVVYIIFFVGFIVLCHLYPVWHYDGPRSYLDVSDLTKHVGLLTALLESGIPPLKPFFNDGLLLNYYYGAYLLPLTIYVVGFNFVDPYVAIVATNVLISAIFLLLAAHLTTNILKKPKATMPALILLTTCFSFDFLMAAINYSLKGSMLGLWQSDSPIVAIFTTPIEFWQAPTELPILSPTFYHLFYLQHLGALAILLFLIVLLSKPKLSLATSALAIILSFSICTYSFFIAGAVTVVLSAYVLFNCLRTRLSSKHVYHDSSLYIFAGFWMLGVLLFYLTFIQADQMKATDHALKFGFPMFSSLSQGSFLAHLFSSSTSTRFIDLMIRYFVKFGPGMLVLSYLIFRTKNLKAVRMPAGILFSLSLLVGLLLVSYVHAQVVYNDVSMKVGALIWLGIVGLIAIHWPDNQTNKLVWIIVCIGGLSSFTYFGWRVSTGPYIPLPSEYQEAYHWIEKNTPRGANILKPPFRSSDPSFPYFATKITPFSDFYHARFMTTSKANFEAQFNRVSELFVSNDLNAKCNQARALAVDYLWIPTKDQHAPGVQTIQNANQTFLPAYKNDKIMIFKVNCPN